MAMHQRGDPAEVKGNQPDACEMTVSDEPEPDKLRLVMAFGH